MAKRRTGREHDTAENNAIFLKGLMSMWNREELKRPPSLALIEQSDRENNTNQGLEARAAFFQIALAVISADGVPNAAAKAELTKFAHTLGNAT
jgi:hypothetical protein